MQRFAPGNPVCNLRRAISRSVEQIVDGADGRFFDAIGRR